MFTNVISLLSKRFFTIKKLFGKVKKSTMEISTIVDQASAVTNMWETLICINCPKKQGKRYIEERIKITKKKMGQYKQALKSN